LASRHPEPQTSAMIATAMQIPCGYMSKVLQSMVHGDVIVSQRGLHGGLALARDPSNITVKQVLNAVQSMPHRARDHFIQMVEDVTLNRLDALLEEGCALVDNLFEKALLSDLVQVHSKVTASGSPP